MSCPGRSPWRSFGSELALSTDEGLPKPLTSSGRTYRLSNFPASCPGRQPSPTTSPRRAASLMQEFEGEARRGRDELLAVLVSHFQNGIAVAAAEERGIRAHFITLTRLAVRWTRWHEMRLLSAGGLRCCSITSDSGCETASGEAREDDLCHGRLADHRGCVDD